MVELAEILTKFRTKSGMSQQEFAKMLGVPQTTWSGYERGQTKPKMGVLFSLAEKGYTIPGLTTGLMDGLPKEAKDKFNENLEIAKGGAFSENMLMDSAAQHIDHVSEFSFFQFSHKKPIPIPAKETDPNAMVLLPLYSQRAAAGSGQEPTQLEGTEAYIPVIMEVLGGSNPRNCGFVRVVGDSMADMTLYDGDLVIFDRSRLEGDGVYVISIGGDVRVKRLEYRTFEKKLVIRSENQKRYPEPEVITFEQASEMLIIHGKVISWVHRHPY